VRWLHSEPHLTIRQWERSERESSFSFLLNSGEILVNDRIDVSKASQFILLPGLMRWLLLPDKSAFFFFV